MGSNAALVTKRANVTKEKEEELLHTLKQFCFPLSPELSGRHPGLFLCGVTQGDVCVCELLLSL